MSLADDVATLGRATVAGLDAGHDYFSHTRRLWRLLQTDVLKKGRTLRLRNVATGSVVSESDLVHLSQDYVAKYLAEMTFLHFVALFENFVFDLLRVWLAAYPQRLAKRQIEFRTVLEAADKDAVTQAVVERELNELRYRRLDEWFEYLEGLVKLGCPTSDEIGTLAEIRATPDILVHNNGIANAVYLSKAGDRARCAEGRALKVPERYRRQSWQAIRRAVQDLTAASLRKATSSVSA